MLEMVIINTYLIISQHLRSDCYTGLGETYDGKHSTTVTGRPCQNWKSKFDFLEDHSYCRNPFGSYGFTRPLCYTSPEPGNYVVEYCDVPKCGV